MDKQLYERFESDEMTEMLDEAAKLFSENYGVWSEFAEEQMGKFAKAGTYSVPQGWLVGWLLSGMSRACLGTA
jgi:hypothetical protein